MNHEYIDEFNLIDRYLMGRLPAEESLTFEEHFVDCPECLADLQVAKRFQQDLRWVAAEQAASREPEPPRHAFGFLPHISLPKPAVWVTACLIVLAAVGAIFVTVYTRHLRSELRQSESQTEQWQRRYEEERQAAISASDRHQETELQQAEQLRALQAKLKDEEGQRARLAKAFNRQLGVEGTVDVFELNAVRGGDLKASESVNPIRLRRSSKMFVFSILLEGERRFANYRVTIADDHGRSVGKSRYLTPDQNDVLSLSFHSVLFQSGHFTLLVEGVENEGGKRNLGIYPFQIIKTP
jgi:hypothetical protein